MNDDDDSSCPQIFVPRYSGGAKAKCGVVPHPSLS